MVLSTPLIISNQLSFLNFELEGGIGGGVEYLRALERGYDMLSDCTTTALHRLPKSAIWMQSKTASEATKIHILQYHAQKEERSFAAAIEVYLDATPAAETSKCLFREALTESCSQSSTTWCKRLASGLIRLLGSLLKSSINGSSLIFRRLSESKFELMPG